MAVEVRKRWLGRQVIRRYKLRRKTKSVTVVVQEVYLRDDICCGSALCRSCVQESPPLAADRSHYMIPDADSLLHFLEIWELPQINSVIYLASVVKEVLAQCNQRNYRRLRTLFTDRRRQSLFFDDEHFIYTWSLLDGTRRLGNAKQSEKRVEAVASWFYEHLHGSVSIIGLQLRSSVSSDEESRSIADKLEGLSVSSETTNTTGRLEVLDVDTYVKEFWRHDSSVTELHASLAQSLRDSEQEQKVGAESQPTSYRWKGGKGNLVYKEHLPGHILETEVASGVLRGGVFRVNKRTPLKGHVKPSNKGDTSQLDISIPGRLLQNRALPGDVVAVRLFAPEARKMLPDGETSNESPDHTGDLKHDVMADDEKRFRLADGPGDDLEDIPSKDYAKGLPVGEVVGILQRNQRDYVACLVEGDEDILRQASSSRWERVSCVPMDRRVPMVSIATRLADSLVGQRFIIRIDKWEQASRIPRGHFVRLLGSIGDLNAETMALLVENGINTSPFSSASLRQLPEDSTDRPWIIPDEELACRRDLRQCHRACSIDPPGSKDVDDALSLRKLPNNLLEIGVHIADVSYFVHQDTLLDLEARARGTTVYMVGKSWHMLPAQLSENLCSLNAGKDRLAVSVIWTVDPEAEFEVLDVWFGRTIIRSRHQMFYAQAQAILDGQTLPPGWELPGHKADEVEAVASDLSILAKFAQLRRDLRVAQGALELSSSELRFETAVNKEPIRVDTKLEVPMNWIVAEMMILANSYVARKIYLAFPSKALLRMHGPPRLDNFTLMLECCAARGFAVDTSSNKALAKSLDRMRESTDPIIENAFRALATRAMSEAQYCSTGEATDSSGFYHYGLALNYYTHFTSPIRRYADVIVHRMLMAACENSSGLEPVDREKPLRKDQDSVLPATEVKEISRHLNERHKASKVAQKECNELYLLMYLQKHAEAEQAVVIAIHDKGMTVFVPKYDIRALVYLQDKKGNVLLPAEDDEIMNDAESLMPTTESRFVWTQPGSIGITDTKSTKVLQEYKLMDTLWVQLRADGSRAHAPKLRVRLLSPTHPAVKKYMLQNTNKGQRRNDLRRDAAESLQPGRNRRANRKLDKNKVINDMVQITASERDSDTATVPPNKDKSSLDRKDLTGKVSLKRKELSINDITEAFKRLKASSTYVDVIENWSAMNGFIGPRESESYIDDSCVSISLGGDLKLVDMDAFIGQMPSTLFMKLAKAAQPAEQLPAEHMRKLWQKKLGRAAKVRAMHLWSVWRDDQEGCRKQLQRREKENQLRSRAKTLGSWVE